MTKLRLYQRQRLLSWHKLRHPSSMEGAKTCFVPGLDISLDFFYSGEIDSNFKREELL